MSRTAATMTPLCSSCGELDRHRAQSTRHQGLVEMTSAAAIRQGERLRHFMCLGCGTRWDWSTTDGWARTASPG